MAREKIDKNETEIEKEQRLDKEFLSRLVEKKDKVAWKRKYDKMQKILVDELQPIEEEINQLISKKIIVFDKMVIIRDELRKECIHPKHLLVHDDNVIICKFCDRRFQLK